MDTTLRTIRREVVAHGYTQEERIRLLRQQQRAGQLKISNNIRDILCTAGIEDFVLLIGGTKMPPASQYLHWSWKSGKNWSASEKHNPKWRLEMIHDIRRRLLKLGGRRLRLAIANLKTMEEIRQALYREYLCSE